MQFSGEHCFTGDPWSQIDPHVSPNAKKHKIEPGPQRAGHPAEAAGK